MPEPGALPAAHGPAVLQATIRTTPEDFRVEELDAFPASGAGEHLLVTIEKRGMTTAEAARRIARWAGVAESAIGHAGLKDRHAIASQRLTVWLPKRIAPDIATLESPTLRVVESHWHSRKLPRGALAGNRFVLLLRDVRGERDMVESRLRAIALHGVPNYFGEQRFGRAGDNVAQALAMFAGRRVRREERAMLLSAARSELFNRVLASRVQSATWRRALEGDVFMLCGTHSIFGPEPDLAAMQARLDALDIDPTGPLWGEGTLRTQAGVAALEQAPLGDDDAALRHGLEAARMKQERRALRLCPQSMDWTWRDEGALQLAFALPPGTYATTVLAELGACTDAMRGAFTADA